MKCMTLSNNGQECAAEFLEKIFNIFGEEHDLGNYFHQNIDLILRNNLACAKCGELKQHIEYYKILPISLSSNDVTGKSIQEVINGDFGNWNMSQDINCHSCSSLQKFYSSRTLDSTPKNIFLWLKRFEMGKKRCDKIHLQTKIYMKMCSNELKQYILKAIIVHRGSSLSSGHYICYIKNGFIWICCDDEKIKRIKYSMMKEDVEKNGYLFLFSRL